MLTADLVRVRKRSGVLNVVELKGKSKARALELAELFLELARDQQGNTYEHLREAWSAVEVGPREKKLADGLLKLIEDDCEFLAESPIDPRQLRGEVFLLASEQRRQSSHENPWSRQVVLTQVAQKYAVEPEQIDAALYSDLRSQHKLQQVSSLSAEQLVERYEIAQYQAVLLRASHVTAKVHFSNPADYRQLFRTLKFRRLLYSVHPLHDGSDGYRIDIDGPFSLFESVTKYGVQLAMVFPALCRASELELKAQLRWGKTREALSFGYHQKRAKKDVELEARLPDDVEQLVTAFEKLGSGWRVKPNAEVFDLPGVGVTIPDLVFTKGKHKIYLEVMGFWSRDAVWKRVELMEAGLPQKLLFAVSNRLRVSEEVLGDDTPGALYVYKGVMSAKAVLGKLEALAERG